MWRTPLSAGLVPPHIQPMRSRKTPSPASDAAFDPFGRYRARRQPQVRCCEHPGCQEAGEHRAPKDRSLTDYQWLCLEHVREFNRRWNYYDGLNDAEVEEQIRQDTCWQRPTWKLGRNGSSSRYGDGPDIHDPFGVYGENVGPGPRDPRRRGQQAQDRTPARDTPEGRALQILGLEWPLTKATLRARYLALVKQHHPDVNHGDKDAEDRVKEINAAYHTLLAGLTAQS